MARSVKFILCVGLAVLVSGCVMRTYTETKERVDQNLVSGNQGYLTGNASPVDESARRKTRTTYVAEVELGSTSKPERTVKATAAPGNQGYVEGTPAMETEEVKPVEPVMVQYKVQKDDTLQKISKHFFGTTKKWYKIYQLNKEKIKNPDRIRPGMTLNIPKE